MNGIFPEWLNANSGRAYPLAENAGRMDMSGSVKIPDSLILAAQINMLPSYRSGTFFIKEVSASPSVILVIIGYRPESGDDRAIATISIPVRSHSENDQYAFVGRGQDSSVLGSLVIGNLDQTLAEIPGGVSFTADSTPFETHALFVSSPALEAVELYSGSSLFGRFDRILKLRAGENIRLSYVDGDPDVIRIDAIPGENLVSPEDCENVEPLPPCIRTINGQPPDENGNFTMDGGKCIDVQASPGIIALRDLCSQSCCGCSELAEIIAGLQRVESQITQFKSQMDITVVQQNLMITNLVAGLQ